LTEEWKLVEGIEDLEDIKTQESLFTQGNGYIGWRGNFEEGCQDGLEGNYINGFYESYPIKYPETAYGFASTGQTMLNVMNAKIIKIRACDEAITIKPGLVENYRRELDFKEGLLRRNFIYRTAKGGLLEIKTERLLSFTRPHCGVIRFEVIPLNFDGNLEIISSINMDIHNQTSGDDPRVGSHLPGNCFTVKSMEGENGSLSLAAKTNSTGFLISCAALHEINVPAGSVMARTEREITVTYTAPCRQGEKIIFTKWISYCTDKAPGGSPEPLSRKAARYVRDAAEAGYEKIKEEQREFCGNYWRYTDIKIDGDPRLQQGLRFNSFQLIQSTGRDGETSISAKGLSGEGYEGHYFWDTETFVLPFFLYNNPEICRNLLKYRYSLLDSARERATEMAHKRGALFPWRTIGGGECSAYFPAGTAQYHINADIAVAIEKYVQATEDIDFLLKYGGEILFETARLWEDLGHYSDEKNGRFCIDCVTGPDEYTALVNNNFYTNIMARENLRYASAVYALMENKYPCALKTLADKISLDKSEPEAWARAAGLMYLPYDEHRGINLQDDSFMQKAEWDFQNTPKENYPLLLHYHPLVIYRHKVLKQADTILADFILDKYMTTEQIKRDYEYYEPRTTHDSSLSACIYGIVACQIGLTGKAYEHFAGALREDLDNGKMNTKDGLHIANMAGTGMCVINGFAGIRQRDTTLIINPQKPCPWRGYSFMIRFRKRLIRLEIREEAAELRLIEGEPISVFLNGKNVFLTIEKAVEEYVDFVTDAKNGN
jgi:alpha,alpha-trehalose phosphorylase